MLIKQNSLWIIHYFDLLLFKIKIKTRRFGDKIGLSIRQDSKWNTYRVGPYTRDQILETEV